MPWIKCARRLSYCFCGTPITVQLLHPHPRSYGVDNGTAFANSKGSAATESKKTGSMSLLEVSNDDLEWESPDAHRVHTYLSELLSQFDREQATEHSIEEAMYVAHDEAISNRDASKERLDHLMKKINATKRSIGKELRELGFSTDGKKLGLDGSTKRANATKKR